jgi:hypothetical protein
MKRIRLLGLTLLAVFALGALAAQGAMAENPTILPEAASSATFTGTSTSAPTLQTTSKQTITCTKAKTKGGFTSSSGGTITLDFEGCKKESSACTGAGEATEVILTGGKFELVDVLPSGTLDLGVLVTPEEGGKNQVTFKCGIITTVVTGQVIGVADNAKGELLKSLEKGKEFILLFKNNGTVGEQAIKTCDFPEAKCKGATFELKSNFGLGAELAAEVVDSTLVFEKEVEFHF